MKVILGVNFSHGLAGEPWSRSCGDRDERGSLRARPSGGSSPTCLSSGYGPWPVALSIGTSGALYWDMDPKRMALAIEASGHKAVKLIHGFRSLVRWYHIGNADAGYAHLVRIMNRLYFENRP